MYDPFVEEVRKNRMEHTEEFNCDLHLICEDMRAFESSLGDRVVFLEAQKIANHRGKHILATENRFWDEGDALKTGSKNTHA